ncbi:MAG: 4Fe-4S binding protein [Nanoarchaeota archaeon]|nr:4Fe-4S binding protein [Nanoarchaeota archaeon]
MKARDIIEFSVGILFLIILSYLIFLPQVRRNLRFFWVNNWYSLQYYHIVYFFLIAMFIFIVFRKNKFLKKALGYLKYPAFFVFLPFALIPLIRCYFKVPYVFCRVCPRKCPWGELRPFIVPAFLLQNLDCRFWCFKLCPFGTLQDYQCRISKKRICLPKWVKLVRYVFLAFTVFVVMALIFNLGKIEGGFFFRGNFDFVLPTIIFSFVVLVLAFFIPRFFCNYFCPIGSFGDIMLKAENRFKFEKKNK